jgi:hypothetical protein
MAGIRLALSRVSTELEERGHDRRFSYIRSGNSIECLPRGINNP